jgi:hypothetical protein
MRLIRDGSDAFPEPHDDAGESITINNLVLISSCLGQQDVLRAEIGQAPGLGADYAEVPALREWRAVRQHKL